MNRSFLIVILPAIAVGIGYLVLFHRRGLALDPFRFIGAAVVIVAAVVLVQRYERRKQSRGNR
jgi:ABC-type spermidine/putrescine transport system permease subunit II